MMHHHRRGFLFVSLLLTAAFPVTSPAESEIDWVYSDPLNIVTSAHHFESANPTADYWEGIVEDGRDPFVVLGPTEIDADKQNFLYLDMAVEEDAQSLQVFFSSDPGGAFIEDDSFRSSNVIPDSERHLYRIDLSTFNGWKGPLRSLRIDFDGSDRGKFVRIYRVGVSQQSVKSDGVVQIRVTSDQYAGHIAPTDPLTPEEEEELFILPPGFEIQLVAAEPDIQKPININFDARGRLWVSSTVEYPYATTDEAKARDTLKILDDFGQDGRARKITTFAENLVIPSGVMPVEDGAIVWSIPNVYRLYDDDGDDKADRKEKLFGPFEYKDTHGNVNNFEWGYDGWIYANHGFANKSKISGRDGHEIVMASGHTWRFRPDGSRVEIVGHGQVNPFGIAFDQLGNLYTADCHSKPVYQILHGASYPTFSVADLKDGLGYGPSICAHSHGSTAICGVACYDDTHFPEEYRGNTFIGNAVTNRVNRDTIAHEGSTYTAVLEPDFVKSKDPWFRPVNVKMGPDGALYIADFYNRIIGHYEVPLDHPGRDRERGRIWRVIYTGPEETRPAEFTREDWTTPSNEELIEDLGHTSQWVRRIATNQLASRDKGEVGPLIEAMLDDSTNTPLQRLHGLWTLQRLGTLSTDRIKEFADDSDERVRVHVHRILAERANWGDGERAIALAGLRDPVSIVQRNAAEALRRHPLPQQVFPLLDSLMAAKKEDIGLVHVLRMASRDQLNLADTWTLILTNPHLHYFQRTLGESIAIGSPTQQAAKFLMDYLEGKSIEKSLFNRLVAHVSRNGNEEEYPRLFDRVRVYAGDNLDTQFHLLKTVNEGMREKGIDLPQNFLSWAEDLGGNCLASDNAETVLSGLDLIQSLRLEKYVPQLMEITGAGTGEIERRSAASRALLEIDFKGHLPLVAGILRNPDESVEARKAAAEVIGKYKKGEAIDALGEAIQTLPWDLATPVAFQLASTDGGADRLIKVIRQGKASVQLLGERKVAEKMQNRRSLQIDESIKELTAGMPTLEEQVAQLIEEKKALCECGEGNLDWGIKVFEKTCAACHRIGDLGEKIGPELDGIGNRGLDRILEDTLDPSRNVDQAYLASLIELDSGEILSGLLKGEEGELVLVADAQGEIQKIPKDEIVDERKSKLSPMPSNIATDLNEEDFRNLMAFLLKQRVED